MSQYDQQQHPYAGQWAAGQAGGGAHGPMPGPGMGPGMGAGTGRAALPPGLPHPYYDPSAAQWPANRLPSGRPSDRFLKGLLIGAAVTYLVTNEQVQRTAIKSVVKTWSLLQGGIEEVKERFGDAAAELRYGDSPDQRK